MDHACGVITGGNAQLLVQYTYRPSLCDSESKSPALGFLSRVFQFSSKVQSFQVSYLYPKEEVGGKGLAVFF